MATMSTPGMSPALGQRIRSGHSSATQQHGFTDDALTEELISSRHKVRAISQENDVLRAELDGTSQVQSELQSLTRQLQKELKLAGEELASKESEMQSLHQQHRHSMQKQQEKYLDKESELQAACAKLQKELKQSKELLAEKEAEMHMIQREHKDAMQKQEQEHLNNVAELQAERTKLQKDLRKARKSWPTYMLLAAYVHKLVDVFAG
jgi:chromosome segregation ATPase